MSEEIAEEVLDEIEEVEVVEGEETEVPAWLNEESDEEAETVPVGAIANVRRKLKGKISEQNDELEKLRLENEKLKQQHSTPVAQEPLKRPRVADFDTDDEYESAMDEYEEKRATMVVSSVEQKKNQQERQQHQEQALKNAVDEHYQRAEKLIQDSGVTAEVYQKADTNVRAAAANALSHVAPDHASSLALGEMAVDTMIANLGEGSEKVIPYLGRNKAKLTEFQNLLQSDPSGIKAAMFLGKISSSISGTVKRKSQAPAPAAQVNGDAPMGANASALKKKYDAAHKKNNHQEAYNLKKQAKLQKIDTTSW